MFEGQYASADKRLIEFISEVARSIRCFDEDLRRCLIQPWARSKLLFPWTAAVEARIRCDIHGGAGQRQRSLSTGKPVADLSTRTCRGSVERLYSSRKIMCLGFQ